MSTCLALILGLVLPAADTHLEQNPLYRQLVQEGVAIDGKQVPPLAEPVMPDGLDADAQRAAMAEITQGRFPVEEFVRDSVVAPNVLAIGPIEASPGGLRLRTMDLYFVAYGSLETLRSNRDWMDRLFRKGEEEAHTLTPQELARRKIEPPKGAADRTRWVHASASVLDRVLVTVTTETVWSETAESTLAAALADPRFADDADYPNQWAPLELNEDGSREAGAARPYLAMASYWKATQLAEPKGAIFIEYHTVFEQPKGWFGGVDLLRSKLPLAVQTELRTFRRRFQQATQGPGQPPRDR